MSDLRVTMVQSQQHWEHKEANFRHFENHLTGVDHSVTDFILLPEMFNTGFTMQTAKNAEKMSGNSVAWLKEMARRKNVRIAATLIIEEDGKFYNRMVIAGPLGIEATYDKKHLFRMAEEDQFFAPGQKRVVYELNNWRILLQTCYDLRFPVFSRNQAIAGKREYDAIIYLANWPAKRAYAWSNLIQARAIENQAYCLGINRVGEDGNQIPYSGNSAAYDPWGNEIADLGAGVELIKTLTLEKAQIQLIDEKFPALLDADNFKLH